MLPAGNLSDMMYPMTADIYYSTNTQNRLGEMVSSWTKDRTVKCSAIKDRPDSSMVNAVISEKFTEYTTKVNFRTDDNILVSSDGTPYPLTDIIIKNIKDPSGHLVWFEYDGEPTKFELGNVEPMYDPMHNFFGYRVLLKRADDQSV